MSTGEFHNFGILTTIFPKIWTVTRNFTKHSWQNKDFLVKYLPLLKIQLCPCLIVRQCIWVFQSAEPPKLVCDQHSIIMNVLKIIETLQQHCPLNILDANTKIFYTRGKGHHIRNIVSNPVCPSSAFCVLLHVMDRWLVKMDTVSYRHVTLYT